ncbi:MAG: substrate-binding periplasmic protein [Thalassotalea sp.]
MKVLFLLFTCLVAIAADACEFKVAIRDTALYSSKDANGKWHGIDIDIYEHLAAAISCKPRYIELPFSDALKLLKLGQVDALTQLSKLPERLETISFVGPVRNETFSLVTSKKVPETITSFDNIANYSYLFAKRKSTYLGAEFHKRYAEDVNFSSKFIEITNVHPRIQLILKNRVVGFFDETFFLQYALKNLKHYDQLKLHPLDIDNGEVFIGLSRKSFSQEQLETLHAAFNDFKKHHKTYMIKAK